MLKSKRTNKFVAWVPALVVVAITAITASGLSLIPGATASTVLVNGSVAGSILIPPTPSAACSSGLTLTSFASAFASTGTCQVTFAANSRSELVYSDTNAGAAFFCGDDVPGAGGVRNCTTNSSRLDNVLANNSAIAADNVGLALTAVAGDGSIGAGSANTLDATPTAAELIWSPINATPRQLCRTTVSNASASCDFVVGGRGEGTTQAAGDYTGSITLTAQAY